MVHQARATEEHWGAPMPEPDQDAGLAIAGAYSPLRRLYFFLIFDQKIVI
jgi:hypothetical protein